MVARRGKLKNTIRCYDNGGKTADRYTVIFMGIPEGRGLYDALGMNSEPFHGIGMSCSAMPGRHLGKRVLLTDLPEQCQKLVNSRLKEIEEANAK